MKMNIRERGVTMDVHKIEEYSKVDVALDK
jgi:hypothetical protein